MGIRTTTNPFFRNKEQKGIKGVQKARSNLLVVGWSVFEKTPHTPVDLPVNQATDINLILCAIKFVATHMPLLQRVPSGYSLDPDP